MSNTNFLDEIKRRRYVAERGDCYALAEKTGKPDEKKRDDSTRGAAQRFGTELAAAGVEKNSVRGLESLAWSTDSVADILDYIRVRVGRDNKWAREGVGVDLANMLEIKLQDDAEKFFKNKPDTPFSDKRTLLLDLCREFIKHLVAHYEYKKSGA